MWTMRKIIPFGIVAFALAAVGSGPSLEAAPQSPVNVLAGRRVAIHGYDPVA